MSSLRPGLHRSVAACTVKGGLDSQEGRERHTEEEGKNNLLTSNKANARVFIRSRDKLFYCQTIEMKHDERELSPLLASDS
jgi:hypothetical protein